MSSYQPLETLLTIKRAAEEATAQVLARETARRAAAEATQLRLDSETQEARRRLRERRTMAASIDHERAARATEREQFHARLADEVLAHTNCARAHREGELARAHASAAAALTAHRVAREAREVVQRLLAKAGAARRLDQARRDEATLDDQGQAARSRGQD